MDYLRYSGSMRNFSPVERVLAVWVVGVVVAVSIAATALIMTNKLVYGPTGQVREYFHALRVGNGSYARGLLNAQIPEGDAALLDGEALKRSVSSLSQVDYEVVETSEDGLQATVRASYTLDGQKQHTDFQLHRSGTHWGFFDKWTIDGDILPTVQVNISGVEAATVNNRKVAVDDGVATFPVFYPGSYAVSYDSVVFTAQKVSEVVTAQGTNHTVRMDLKPSDNALESVKDQVREYVQACAAKNTLYPEGCPFEYAFTGRVDSAVQWKVEKIADPQVSVNKQGAWLLKPMTGTAKVSFTQLDLYTGARSRVQKEIPFTLKASIQADSKAVHVIF